MKDDKRHETAHAPTEEEKNNDLMNDKRPATTGPTSTTSDDKYFERVIASLSHDEFTTSFVTALQGMDMCEGDIEPPPPPWIRFFGEFLSERGSQSLFDKGPNGVLHEFFASLGPEDSIEMQNWCEDAAAIRGMQEDLMTMLESVTGSLEGGGDNSQAFA